MIDVTGIGSWAQVDLNGEFDLVTSTPSALSSPT